MTKEETEVSLNTIDAALKRYFISGANNINNNKEYINELNVFPVPDGDTGTNMTLTIMTAAAEVDKLEKPTIDSLAKAISNGSLRGARGNSGVILSQLFRGFCKDIKGKDKLYPLDIALAFSRAVDTAYKAVMKPKEGTILTVAKGMSEKASEIIEALRIRYSAMARRFLRRLLRCCLYLRKQELLIRADRVLLRL